MSAAIAEVQWIYNSISDLNGVKSDIPTIYCGNRAGNRAAIKTGSLDSNHAKSRNIVMHYYHTTVYQDTGMQPAHLSA